MLWKKKLRPRQCHVLCAVVWSYIVRHSSEWRESILGNRLPRSDKIAGTTHQVSVIEVCHDGFVLHPCNRHIVNSEIAFAKNETIKVERERRHRCLQAWCVGQGSGERVTRMKAIWGFCSNAWGCNSRQPRTVHDIDESNILRWFFFKAWTKKAAFSTCRFCSMKCPNANTQSKQGKRRTPHLVCVARLARDISVIWTSWAERRDVEYLNIYLMCLRRCGLR